MLFYSCPPNRMKKANVQVPKRCFWYTQPFKKLFTESNFEHIIFTLKLRASLLIPPLFNARRKSLSKAIQDCYAETISISTLKTY